jgi:hypothetical protein
MDAKGIETGTNPHGPTPMPGNRTHPRMGEWTRSASRNEGTCESILYGRLGLRSKRNIPILVIYPPSFGTALVATGIERNKRLLGRRAHLLNARKTLRRLAGNIDYYYTA